MINAPYRFYWEYGDWRRINVWTPRLGVSQNSLEHDAHFGGWVDVGKIYD